MPNHPQFWALETRQTTVFQGNTGPLPPGIPRLPCVTPSPWRRTTPGRPWLGSKEGINTGRNAEGGGAAAGCPTAGACTAGCTGVSLMRGLRCVRELLETQPRHAVHRPWPPTLQPFAGPALRSPPRACSGTPGPTSLAAPLPETTSASLGPTVWQLPMVPGGTQRSRCTDHTAAARPQRRPHPAYPATPSAPLWSQPRRKCGDGGRGRHVERGRRQREP